MSVGSYDPSAASVELDLAVVRELMGLCADDQGAEFTLELDADQQSRFAPLVTHAQWASHVGELSSAEITQLIRIFTFGEQRFSSWRADDKSAVIPLVRELKARGEYHKDLTRWIKNVSDNKFLPHGNLLDRL